MLIKKSGQGFCPSVVITLPIVYLEMEVHPQDLLVRQKKVIRAAAADAAHVQSVPLKVNPKEDPKVEVVTLEVESARRICWMEGLSAHRLAMLDPAYQWNVERRASKVCEQELHQAAGSDAVTTVTGYRGRSVQIKCHYESGYEENNKYLCRGECPGWPSIKDIPVQSGSPAEDTRFSLYDDTTARIFTVTITDLRAEDANTYWCVVQQKGPNIYTELQLLVVDDSSSSSVSTSTNITYSASSHIMSPSVHTETPPATVTALTSTNITYSASSHIMSPSVHTETPPATAGSDAVTTVTGYRGRSVQIKCHYESGYEKNNKYLCRGECPRWPAIKDIPVQSGSPAEDTRFSLYDDTTAKIFTITITDLRAEDANTYWCVVQQKGPNIYTELQLLVVGECYTEEIKRISHNNSLIINTLQFRDY
ncbi:CMRF35-like molecule 3 [Silurus meridionalis]|nr:CMRF35-like molecule 3 [Silurus meridionalis]